MAYISKEEAAKLWEEVSYRDWKHLSWKFEEIYKKGQELDNNLAYEMMKKSQVLESVKEPFPKSYNQLCDLLNSKVIPNHN